MKISELIPLALCHSANELLKIIKEIKKQDIELLEKNSEKFFKKYPKVFNSLMKFTITWIIAKLTTDALKGLEL